MGELIYLEEIKIKKEIDAAINELQKARTASTKGINISKKTFDKLERTIIDLEKKLRNYILKTN